MAVVPFLTPIESRFEWQSGQPWLVHYGTVSICMSAVYLVLTFVGRRWMHSRPAFSLRQPLVMWNTGLALFSIIGFFSISPSLTENLVENGFGSSVCRGLLHLGRPGSTSGQLWCLLFLLSKTVELGDTAFIVLRKTPLNFLHWYHHVTVFVYCAWFSSGAPGESAITLWFGTTNYLVHSLMYSYYTAKAAGVRVPRWVAQMITTLQLVQFVLGVITILTVLILKTNGAYCDAPYDFLYAGLAMYVSYFILFLNFFYQRYLKKAE